MQILSGDWIEVRDLALSCVVGVLEREQRTVQTVRVDLGLCLDLTASGDGDDLEASLDYALVADQVRFLAEHGRFRLLEALGLVALRLLLAPASPLEGRASASQAWIRMAKPEVLGGNPVPTVQLARLASQAAGVEGPARASGGAWLLRLPMVSVGRWEVAPGERFQQGADEALLVLAGELGGRGRGERFTRPGRGQAWVAGASGAVLLAVGHEGSIA